MRPPPASDKTARQTWAQHTLRYDWGPTDKVEIMTRDHERRTRVTEAKKQCIIGCCCFQPIHPRHSRQKTCCKRLTETLSFVHTVLFSEVQKNENRRSLSHAVQTEKAYRHLQTHCSELCSQVDEFGLVLAHPDQILSHDLDGGLRGERNLRNQLKRKDGIDVSKRNVIIAYSTWHVDQAIQNETARFPLNHAYDLVRCGGLLDVSNQLLLCVLHLHALAV